MYNCTELTSQDTELQQYSFDYLISHTVNSSYSPQFMPQVHTVVSSCKSSDKPNQTFAHYGGPRNLSNISWKYSKKTF